MKLINTHVNIKCIYEVAISIISIQRKADTYKLHSFKNDSEKNYSNTNLS